MPILDVEKIINGTDDKQLANAHLALAEEYTDEKAQAYRAYYMEKPLSFVLKHASHVIAEPQYGVPYMRWVAEHAMIPYDKLQNLKGVVKEYLEDHRERMSDRLITLYENFDVDLEELLGERQPEAAVVTSTLADATAEDEEDKLIDSAFSKCCEVEAKKPDSKFAVIFQNVEPPIMGPDALESCMRDLPAIVSVVTLTPYAESFGIAPSVSAAWMKVIDPITESAKETYLESASKNLITCEKIQYLMQSKRFLEAANALTNGNTRAIIRGIANANVPSESNRLYAECTEDTTLPIYTDSLSTVNAMFTESTYDEIYAEDRKETLKNLFSAKHALYENMRKEIHAAYESVEDVNVVMVESPMFSHVRETFGYSEPVSWETGLRIITEAVAEIESSMEEQSFFERGDTGRINGVISKRHPILNEQDAKSGFNPQNKNASTATASNTDEDEDLDEGSINSSNSVRKQPASAPSAGLPSDANPNASMPQKPKQGIIKGIQNAGTKISIASKKTGAAVKSVGGGLVRGAKSVLKVPAGLVNGIKGLIHDFDTWDDNRRKQYMVQPGFRKKIFRNLKVAIMYGMSWAFHPLMVIVTFMGRSFSKEKNKRIRNEFITDLEAEIEVTNQKIEDAKMEGRRDASYQLTRVRAQLQKEHDRVALNGKYI